MSRSMRAGLAHSGSGLDSPWTRRVGFVDVVRTYCARHGNVLLSDAAIASPYVRAIGLGRRGDQHCGRDADSDTIQFTHAV
jgi:hypothetical protein